jgi:hypothetical protein
MLFMVAAVALPAIIAALCLLWRSMQAMFFMVDSCDPPSY